MAQWARHTTAIALVTFGMLLAAHYASAQYGRGAVDRELALPALGPNQLRVVPPTPEVQVIGDEDGEEDSPSSRQREPRRVPSIERPSVDRSSGRPPPSDPPPRETRSQRQRSTERSGGSSSDVSPTPQTFRRAPGEERDASDPVEYGRLIVMTEFENVRVTIAGEPYPFGSLNGVLLYAGEQYDVVFSQADSEGSSSSSEQQGRVVTVRVGAGETRVLLANLGSGTVASPPRSARSNRSQRNRARETRADEEEEIGYLGVSSSPRGTVYVDGENTGETTPARRIELEPGRHEVRIFYESEERFSETKNVLIRDGVNTNVFFRLRREDTEEDEDD